MAAAPNRSTTLITSPRSNDVLLGRGSRVNEFIGNQQFRRLVEMRREDYNWAHKNKEKQMIARQLLDHIQSLDGRFLKLVESETSESAAEKEVWYEVEESVALEKCKQALREQKQVSLHGTNGGFIVREATWQAQNSDSSKGMDVGVAVNPALRGEFVHGHIPSPLTPVLPSMLVGSMGPCVVDVHNFLFQSVLNALQQQATAVQPMATNAVVPPHSSGSVKDQNVMSVPYAGSMPQGSGQDLHRATSTSAAAAYGSNEANNVLSSQLQSVLPQTDSVSHEFRQSSRQLSAGGEVVANQSDSSSCTTATSSPSTSEGDITAKVCEDDMSEFLLSLFENSGRPRFTEQQEEIEQSTLTDDEKAAALADLFGRSCAVSTHKNKRAKLDLDRNSIEFLIQQMRLELERIPLDRKRALVEAQMKCGTDEFSCARLERFLRCEGMNAKLGAQRFVNYWESRREVFGPEKFVLHMTLDEALCDDLVALEACVCRPLPRLDTSGRQLLLVVPGHHTREGYTSESMLRAIWYVIELLAQANTDVRSGTVMIVWDKDFTIWDYDQRLYERMTYFDMNCWPVKVIACHVFIAPWFMIKVVKPFLNALRDKQSRSRTLLHDDSDSQLLDILSNYGILKEMLPTEMGGNLQLNQAKWIANRRAVELELI